MQSVPLGNSGERVSALCFGAMFLGTHQDEATSFRLLDQYVDAGGTFIDTANIYAHWTEGGRGGESEALLGRWLRARGHRDRLFLASKVGFGYPGIEDGLEPWRIEEECDKSLRLLGVDALDLYYAHVDDRATPQEETLGAFAKLVQAGKVRYLGASNFRAWRLADAAAISATQGWPGYCCIQQRHTYLRPTPGASFGGQVVANADLFDYVRAQQGALTLLAYSALLGGAYTRADRPLPEQYRGPDSDARLAVLRQAAGETGCSPNQIVLAWLRQSDPPVLPLIAASSSEQLAENLGALDLTLSTDQMARLDAAGA